MPIAMNTCLGQRRMHISIPSSLLAMLRTRMGRSYLVETSSLEGPGLA